MRAQIIDKLNKFLNERPQIKEECEVVYLMVELRKLLDRERDQNGINSYSLVRFHADWTLHTRKDRVTPAMKKIMSNIGDSIDTYPKNDDIDFLLLPEFRKELTQLLEKYGLRDSFCKNDNEWMDFMMALTQVLADQPIINPTKDITEFCYIDMQREGIMANIAFGGARAGGSIVLGFGP